MSDPTTAELTISASQIDTYLDCNRFWWFRRMQKLPEPPASHFTFGTVLHGVAERWLSATENGRVPEGSTKNGVLTEGPLKFQVPGSKVDLYPTGWEAVTERDGSTASVTPNEAKLIKRLIAEAIESGVLRRGDIQVERKVLFNLIKGVDLIGYIDGYRPPSDTTGLPEIEDHKTFSKGSVRFLKNDRPDSPNYLGSNQQLRTYAVAISQLDGWDGPVKLRHNQFPKFPGRAVSSVDTDIDRGEVLKHREFLMDIAARMRKTSKIEKWVDVPGPSDSGKCARWYGKPCPFHKICGRQETPESYLQRTEKQIQQHGESPSLNVPIHTPRKRKKPQEASVSIFDRANKQKNERDKSVDRKAKAGSAKAKAAVKPINGTTSDGKGEVAASAHANPAPWANPACSACKGRGMNTKGLPCPICDTKAKREKRPTSLAYVVEVDDDGMGVAAAREEHVEALEAAGMALEWFEGAEPSEASQAAEEPDEEQAEEEPEAEEEPAPKAAPKAAQRAAKPEKEPKSKPKAKAAPRAVTKASGESAGKRGRKPVGLTILVGAMYLRGAERPVITSTQVLERFGSVVAERFGNDCYWELDTWKRRECIAKMAPEIVEELSRHILVHPGILGNDDVGSMLHALMAVESGLEYVIVATI